MGNRQSLMDEWAIRSRSWTNAKFRNCAAIAHCPLPMPMPIAHCRLGDCRSIHCRLPDCRSSPLPITDPAFADYPISRADSPIADVFAIAHCRFHIAHCWEITRFNSWRMYDSPHPNILRLLLAVCQRESNGGGRDLIEKGRIREIRRIDVGECSEVILAGGQVGEAVRAGE
jgi:hypothetical protein